MFDILCFERNIYYFIKCQQSYFSIPQRLYTVFNINLHEIYRLSSQNTSGTSDS